MSFLWVQVLAAVAADYDVSSESVPMALHMQWEGKKLMRGVGKGRRAARGSECQMYMGKGWCQ